MGRLSNYLSMGIGKCAEAFLNLELFQFKNFDKAGTPWIDSLFQHNLLIEVKKLFFVKQPSDDLSGILRGAGVSLS